MVFGIPEPCCAPLHCFVRVILVVAGSGRERHLEDVGRAGADAERAAWPRACLGCAYVSTQEGGASHDSFGVLLSITFPKS